MRLLILAACLSLGACASLADKPVANQAQLVVADAGTAIDASYNSVAKLYLAAAPGMSADLKAKLKLQFKAAYVFVLKADKASAVGDMAALALNVASAKDVLSALLPLIPKH